MRLASSAIATGIRLIALDTVASTNAEALTHARTGEVGPLWIVARMQTAGRGRRGRAWVSEPGNLYATLLLTEPSPPEHAAQLSFVAALAVHDALAQFIPDPLMPTLTLKWPNDVLLGGEKISGILIEGEGRAVAIGIGINCAHHPRGVEFPATDLRAAGVAASVEQVFHALSETMSRRLMQWDSGLAFAAIHADWVTRADGMGKDIRVRLHDRETTGCFEALDPQGRVVLRRADGAVETITAGDVFPLHSPPAEHA